MDTLGIIRQIQQDPALADELRAVLLTREVLDLPRLVAENSRQIATLAENIDRVESQIATLAERVESQIATLAERIDSLAGAVQGQVIRFEDMIGKFLEHEIESRPSAFVTKNYLRDVEVLDPHEFEEIRDNLSPEEAANAGELDAVLVGRRPDGVEAYAAIEASVTLDSDDLTRAKERAEILTRASSMPVLALAVTDNKPTLVIINLAKSLNVAISRKSQRFDVDALFIEPSESGGSNPGIAI